MRKAGKKIYISLTIAAFIFHVSAAYSATANIYDDPKMISVKSGANIAGYYSNVAGLFSCQFFFMTNLYSDVISRDKNYYVLKIKTFITGQDGHNFDYVHRDMEFNISGTLYLYNDNFVLKTDKHQAGCASAAGLFDSADGERGALQYNVVKHIPVIGIRMVSKKMGIYQKPGSGKKSGYLDSGDIVLLIKENRGYSYVRYVNPDSNSNQIKTGWVRSTNIANPFPPLSGRKSRTGNGQ